MTKLLIINGCFQLVLVKFWNKIKRGLDDGFNIYFWFVKIL